MGDRREDSRAVRWPEGVAVTARGQASYGVVVLTALLCGGLALAAVALPVVHALAGLR